MKTIKYLNILTFMVLFCPFFKMCNGPSTAEKREAEERRIRDSVEVALNTDSISLSDSLYAEPETEQGAVLADSMHADSSSGGNGGLHGGPVSDAVLKDTLLTDTIPGNGGTTAVDTCANTHAYVHFCRYLAIDRQNNYRGTGLICILISAITEHGEVPWSLIPLFIATLITLFMFVQSLRNKHRELYMLSLANLVITFGTFIYWCISIAGVVLEAQWGFTLYVILNAVVFACYWRHRRTLP